MAGKIIFRALIKHANSYFQLFVSERRPIKVQIISDSISKHVPDIHHTEVKAFPGTHINHGNWCYAKLF